MTIFDLVRLTRANVLLILASVTAGVLAMFAYTLTLPVTYSAAASGLIVVGVANDTGTAMSYDQFGEAKAAEYASLAGKRTVQERAVKIVQDNDGPVEATQGGFSAFSSGKQLTVVSSASTPDAAMVLANAGLMSMQTEIIDFQNIGAPEGAPEVRLAQLVPTEEAGLPGGPSSPNYQKNLMLGAAGGLLLGYVLAFMRRSLDHRVRGVEDVETAAGVSVVGVIPKTEPLADDSRGIDAEVGQADEAFRTLRTNLRFVDVDHPPRSIVVTSANAGEGKSTVAANLARVMAAAGQHVVLVDADLRRPMLASTFGVDSQVGLTQVLAGDVPVTEAVIDSGHANLSLLAAGRIPPNPSELLGSHRMHQLVAELSRDHIVILDAPPLLPVTDAGLLTALCDGAILVVAVGSTFQEQVALCRKVLSQVGGRMLGAVINKAPMNAFGSIVYGYGYGNYRSEYKSRSQYYESGSSHTPAKSLSSAAKGRRRKAGVGP